MIIKLIKLTLQNFKGCKERTSIFGDITSVYGDNATGKSTLVDGFMWLLFGKNAQSDSKFGIRPVDSEGNLIDNVEIIVEAELEVNGERIVLKKVQRQNWVKERGTGIIGLKGNPNYYWIDEVPKKEKDYKEYIDNLISEDLFKLITNPMMFTSLDWEKQRKILIKMISDVTNEDVILTDSKFEVLREKLAKKSIEDLTAIASAAYKKYKEEQKLMPARIDEASRDTASIDFSEAEAKKAEIEKQLEALDLTEQGIDEECSVVNKMKDQVMKLKFQRSDLERIANISLVEKKSTLKNLISNDELDKANIERTISQNKAQIKQLEQSIALYEEGRKKATEEWKKVNKSKFDETTLVCTVCGQELPSDKREEIIAEFESKKSTSIERIEKTGFTMKSKIDEATKAKLDLEAQNELRTTDLESCNRTIEQLNNEVNELPVKVDVSDNEEIKSIENEIADLESKISVSASPEDIRQALKENRKTIMAEMQEVNKELAKKDIIERATSRVEELKQEQRQLSQDVANQERELDLLKDFSKAKMDLLSSKINAKFKLVNFKMFNEQVNGGFADTCECTLNGVSYKDLNSAAKIQAGLDIISSLSDMYNAYAPIWIDNAESINEIPVMKSQTIKLIVSKDKELVIK